MLSTIFNTDDLKPPPTKHVKQTSVSLTLKKIGYARVSTNDLEVRNIGFQSVTENIDTTSSTGKLIFHIFASLAEFERGLIRDRVLAGLEAAKKRGKKFGRPDALNDKQKEMAVAMFNGGAPKIDIAKHFGVTRQTVYSLLKGYEV